MAFLMSRSASVDRTAREVVKAGVSTSESHKLHPSQCHVRLVSVHVLRYISLVSPSLAIYMIILHKLSEILR